MNPLDGYEFALPCPAHSKRHIRVTLDVHWLWSVLLIKMSIGLNSHFSQWMSMNRFNALRQWHVLLPTRIPLYQIKSFKTTIHEPMAWKKVRPI
ncbi:unnamed protein product [Absidia cylindrospora]